ncbi:palmdelphin isoform X3 [Seriola aureovittata]|uniref:palmdelphin isoform X3 n=1 Tax=Seriola aureovittata TaxID=2871759 RepID=UPI0024BE29DB|nr:palmdelphin isoform X3 [Seriola aureovittata]
MEEADLLKERLQAITDKRRIQEDIAKKRRQIEEEKLKLQYIKKKALREQWLMDGLSQQSEQEQEAMRLQAQDEQQQSDQLQINILRIEKEVEALETQELNISANEEAVLKRLKEVERTAEDIIKELNADFQTDGAHHVSSPLPDLPSCIMTPVKPPPQGGAGGEELKKATFAMEISVEHNKRTGRSQVVSAASITPETIQGRGLKVYDDGRKSVYALHPDGGGTHNGAVGEMTPTEVEELLRQATDKDVPTEVQYHQPVYSAPYTGGSRPSTPRTPSKTQRVTPTPSPPHGTTTSRNGAQGLTEENQLRPDEGGQKPPSKTPIKQDSTPRAPPSGGESKPPSVHRPGQEDKHRTAQSDVGDRSPRGLSNSRTDRSSPNPAALVSVTARSEGMPAPTQPVYRAVDTHNPSLQSHKSDVGPDRQSPFCAESVASLNLVNTLPGELQSEPVTMIFMGYEKAEDEEEEDIQAELVVIANSDDDDDDDDDDDKEAQCVKEESVGEDSLSYHPEGYRSRVFQPRVGVAKVTGGRNMAEDACSHCDDLGLHKPTFTHKPGKHSPYLQGGGGGGGLQTQAASVWRR